ncbi:hypothetical protein SHIRM173S_04769 [Streptomyces hirsutus]
MRLRPQGEFAQTWLIAFRATQGLGAALLLPAGPAVVVAVFPVERRGRALALGIAFPIALRHPGGRTGAAPAPQDERRTGVPAPRPHPTAVSHGARRVTRPTESPPYEVVVHLARRVRCWFHQVRKVS